MTPFDSKFPALAKRLIAKHGVQATIVRQNKVYDPANDTTTTTDPTTIVLKVSPPSDESSGRGQNTEQITKLSCYCDGQQEPKIGDKLTVLGKTYDVPDVTPLYSGELTAAYQIWLD